MSFWPPVAGLAMLSCGARIKGGGIYGQIRARPERWREARGEPARGRAPSLFILPAAAAGPGWLDGCTRRLLASVGGRYAVKATHLDAHGSSCAAANATRSASSESTRPATINRGPFRLVGAAPGTCCFLTLPSLANAFSRAAVSQTPTSYSLPSPRASVFYISSSSLPLSSRCRSRCRRQC